MTINSTKMQKALRAKFKTPSNLLRALGLDAAELNDAGEHDKDNDLAGLIDWCANQGGMSGELVAELSQRLETLVHRSRLEGQRRVEAAAEDDEPHKPQTGVAALRAHLRKAGFSPQEIEAAVASLGAGDAHESLPPAGGRARDTSEKNLTPEQRVRREAEVKHAADWARNLPRDLGGRERPAKVPPSMRLGMDAASEAALFARYPGIAGLRVI